MLGTNTLFSMSFAVKLLLRRFLSSATMIARLSCLALKLSSSSGILSMALVCRTKRTTNKLCALVFYQMCNWNLTTPYAGTNTNDSQFSNFNYLICGRCKNDRASLLTATTQSSKMFVCCTQRTYTREDEILVSSFVELG